MPNPKLNDNANPLFETHEQKEERERRSAKRRKFVEKLIQQAECKEESHHVE